MPNESVSASSGTRIGRIAPYSEDAEKGVLGSMLLDPLRVVDLSIESQLIPESFYVPAHSLIYAALREMSVEGGVIDVLTVSERMSSAGTLDKIGGSTYLDRLVDSTPTAAHAEFYIDIVRQKDLLRRVITCSHKAENLCYDSQERADTILGHVEQSFLDIAEGQHSAMMPWSSAIKNTMEHIENVFNGAKVLSGIPTGLKNLDHVAQGLRNGEMIVLAARPSMGKTSLAMNIAENVALGLGEDKTPRAVGVFSLEMSQEALVMRMLCSHAGVSSFRLARGYVSQTIHGKLTQAASVLMKAPMYLDDTGGLDISELRARARRMHKKHDIKLILIDYLQLLNSKEYARQGRQIETSNISGNIKAMAKELNIPVLVLSQLSRAPEQRDKLGKPKLSDLRDSGAIEQDADVVCMLRRPCKYQEDEESEDRLLAVVDIVKQRNGPTGEVRLNFEEEFTRFRDRAQGVDGLGPVGHAIDPEPGQAADPAHLEQELDVGVE